MNSLLSGLTGGSTAARFVVFNVERSACSPMKPRSSCTSVCHHATAEPLRIVNTHTPHARHVSLRLSAVLAAQKSTLLSLFVSVRLRVRVCGQGLGVCGSSLPQYLTTPHPPCPLRVCVFRSCPLSRNCHVTVCRGKSYQTFLHCHCPVTLSVVVSRIKHSYAITVLSLSE